MVANSVFSIITSTGGGRRCYTIPINGAGSTRRIWWRFGDTGKVDQVLVVQVIHLLLVHAQGNQVEMVLHTLAVIMVVVVAVELLQVGATLKWWTRWSRRINKYNRIQQHHYGRRWWSSVESHWWNSGTSGGQGSTGGGGLASGGNAPQHEQEQKYRWWWWRWF